MTKFYIFIISMLLWAGTASAQCKGFIFKIKDGKLTKNDNSGNFRGSITDNAADFDCNDDYVFVVKNDGKLSKYDFSGNQRGSITSEVNKVRVAGDYLIVTKAKGKTYKYDFSGNNRGSL